MQFINYLPINCPPLELGSTLCIYSSEFLPFNKLNKGNPTTSVPGIIILDIANSNTFFNYSLQSTRKAVIT